MDTVKLVTKNNVKMVAHRGVSGLETENTNAAFIAAGNRSYFGVETDVRRTADGQFILLHDDNTERVGIDKLFPEQSTFETLRALKLRDKNGVRSRADLHLCSMEEYIETCKRYEKRCVLELKGGYTEEWLGEMVERIKAIGWLENVIFISFSLENLVKLRGLLPEQPMQYLTGQFDEVIFDNLKKYHFGLDIYIGGLHEEDVKRIHDAGLEVNVWTVDRLEDAERMVSWGVDYITSNIIE